MCSSSAYAQTPAPDFLNLTDLLTVATGPFHTFLGYLESTKVIETFQWGTELGITIFAPRDSAFTSLKTRPSLSDLTADQLKSLVLFHALARYYALADFKNLAPVATLAGKPYTENFTTDVTGFVDISAV